MNKLISKIALGTAQFGLNYGINNTTGMISEEECGRILDGAFDHGVTTIDTAYLYGLSEERIGNYLSKTSRNFKIVSKLPACNKDQIESFLSQSLSKLNLQKLHGYLFHSFKDYLADPGKWEIMNSLKQSGLIEKIGFTLYYPGELEYLLNQKIRFDLLQIPYNIFDQRFESYFNKLKQLGIEIHVRSVFLQGFVFKDISSLPVKLVKFKGKIEELERLSNSTGLTIREMCLGFALVNECIDKIVIGVDSLDHLYENIDAVNSIEKVNENYPLLKSLQDDNEELLIPTNWS